VDEYSAEVGLGCLGRFAGDFGCGVVLDAAK
jgi:hypothetical protein